MYDNFEKSQNQPGSYMLIHEMKLKSPHPDDHCLTASTCNVSLLVISFFAARERITSMEFLTWSSVANTWPKTKERKMATLKTDLKVKLKLYLRPTQPGLILVPSQLPQPYTSSNFLRILAVPSKQAFSEVGTGIPLVRTLQCYPGNMLPVSINAPEATWNL